MNGMDRSLDLPSRADIRSEQETVRMIADIIETLSRCITKRIQRGWFCRFRQRSREFT